MPVCRVWQSFTRFCACYGNFAVVFYGRKEKIVSESARLCRKGFTAFFWALPPITSSEAPCGQRLLKSLHMLVWKTITDFTLIKMEYLPHRFCKISSVFYLINEVQGDLHPDNQLSTPLNFRYNTSWNRIYNYWTLLPWDITIEKRHICSSNLP